MLGQDDRAVPFPCKIERLTHGGFDELIGIDLFVAITADRAPDRNPDVCRHKKSAPNRPTDRCSFDPTRNDRRAAFDANHAGTRSNRLERLFATVDATFRKHADESPLGGQANGSLHSGVVGPATVGRNGLKQTEHRSKNRVAKVFARYHPMNAATGRQLNKKRIERTAMIGDEDGSTGIEVYNSTIINDFDPPKNPTQAVDGNVQCLFKSRVFRRETGSFPGRDERKAGQTSQEECTQRILKRHGVPIKVEQASSRALTANV